MEKCSNCCPKALGIIAKICPARTIRVPVELAANSTTSPLRRDVAPRLPAANFIETVAPEDISLKVAMRKLELCFTDTTESLVPAANT